MPEETIDDLTMRLYNEIITAQRQGDLLPYVNNLARKIKNINVPLRVRREQLVYDAGREMITNGIAPVPQANSINISLESERTRRAPVESIREIVDRSAEVTISNQRIRQSEDSVRISTL